MPQLLRSLCGALLVGLSPLGAAHAATELLMPFQATYTINWHGLTAGVSTLTLEHQQGERWVYRSVSEARGFARLLPIGAVALRSEMSIDAQGVHPQHFTADDGTSSTKRDIDVTFDWERMRIRGTAEDKPVDEPLTAGTQDDLSVQIALIHELAQDRVPELIRTFGDRGMREYRYVREGEETLDTPLGKVETIVYNAARAGSPRVTRYWCAPSKGYLPMKVQQKRLESVEFTLEVRTLQRG